MSGGCFGMPDVPAIGRFAAIGLDDLVDRAALLTRVDRKYLLTVDAAAAAVDRLDPRTRVLQIDDSRQFAYDSVYFDTPDHLSYRMTAHRRRRRFKVRTRSYLDSGGCFLEVKSRSGRGTTVKQRLAHQPSDRARLTPAGAEYAREVLGSLGHQPAVVDQLEAGLVVRYHRSTLLLADGSRATIDTRLHWMDDATIRGRKARLAGYVIVETKSAGRPTELDRTLWRAGRRPVGISKFGTGTAVLHPELPSNKWARQLQHPFEIHRYEPWDEQ